MKYINEPNPEPLITKEMVEENRKNFPFKKPNRKTAIYDIAEMEKASKGPFKKLPNGLTDEKLHDFLMKDD